MHFDGISEFSQRVVLRKSIATLFPFRKLCPENVHLLLFSVLLAKQTSTHKCSGFRV